MNLKYGTDSPVLFYKKLGDSCEQYSCLGPDDFMLVIATEFQLEMLQLFGNEKICVDGTHGLNSYQYQLFSVLVVDEYSNGVPVGYCFCNTGDTDVMKIFFGVLKTHLMHPLDTKILMTDDDPVFVNAWTCVMGPPKMHLLCTWHFNKHWLEHLNSIKSPKKRKLVRSTLYPVSYTHLTLPTIYSV